MTRRRKVFTTSIALVLGIGLVASAQTSPVPRGARNRAGALGLAAGAGISDLPARGAARKPHLASLENILLPPGKAVIARLAVVMKLTADQRRSVKGLYQSFAQDAKPAIKDRRAAMRDAGKALKASDRGAYDAAIGRYQDASRTILSAEFRFWDGFKHILTDDQRAQLENARARIKQRLQQQLRNRGRQGALGGSGLRRSGAQSKGSDDFRNW